MRRNLSERDRVPLSVFRNSEKVYPRGHAHFPGRAPPSLDRRITREVGRVHPGPPTCATGGFVPISWFNAENGLESPVLGVPGAIGVYLMSIARIDL
jgi:hypothetical protein